MHRCHVNVKGCVIMNCKHCTHALLIWCLCCCIIHVISVAELPGSVSGSNWRHWIIQTSATENLRLFIDVVPCYLSHRGSPWVLCRKCLFISASHGFVTKAHPLAPQRQHTACPHANLPLLSVCCSVRNHIVKVTFQMPLLGFVGAFFLNSGQNA